MASFVSFLMIICSILISNILAQVEDVCLFGRYDTDYWTEINGPFRYVAQDVNDKHYYKQDNAGLNCSIDTYYMFFWNENSKDEDGILPSPSLGWYIGFATGFNPFTGAIAHCTTINADTPDQCASWEFLRNGVWRVDGNVTVTAGRCPQLDCAALEVDDGTGSNDGCTTWTVSSNLGEDEPLLQIGSNAFSEYKTGFGVRTLYFNYKLWRWICVKDTTELELGCKIPDAYFNDYLVLLQPADQRVPFTEIGPDSGSVDFPMEDDQLAINTLTATCQGDGTTSTYAPTTPNPTRNPSMTPQPTFRPVTYGPTTAQPTPASPVTPQPTSPTPKPPTSPTEAQGAGGGDDDDGCDRWGTLCWWIWLIIIIAILCCCCLCCYLCFVLFKKRKENKAKNVEMFGTQDNAGNTGSYRPDPTYTVD